MAAPLRVALLTNFIPPYRLPMFEALAQRAAALRVLVSTRMESDRSWPVEWGSLDVVEQRTMTIKRFWRTGDRAEAIDLHIPIDTSAQLARFKPDIIITGEMGARSVQAMRYGSRTGTPVVLWATLSERTERKRGRIRQQIRKWLTRHATGVVVNGESGASYMRSLGAASDKLVRVPYTTDMQALLALPLDRQPNDQIRLLYVGSLTERKGLHHFVGGLIKYALAHPGKRLAFTLVGEGPLRDALSALPMPPNLHIDWRGSLAYDELPAAYADSDIFVFPSLSDEWGVVVNEAMAAGLPVLGSRYSQAAEELVKDDVNGWLFEPVSESSVVAVLERALAKSATDRQQMRVVARESVRGLTPDAAAQAMLDGINELMSR